MAALITDALALYGDLSAFDVSLLEDHKLPVMKYRGILLLVMPGKP